MIVIHRKPQDDILPTGIPRPWLVIHWDRPGHSARLFCLWRGGLWLRLLGKKRLCWVWARPQLPAWKPDFTGVELFPGFIAHVSPDVPPETVEALKKMGEIMAKLYSLPMDPPDPPRESNGNNHDLR